MRWTVDRGDGKHRLVRRFLLLPVEIDGEVRWLEWATIEQELMDNYMDGSYWQDLRFMEEDKS